MPWAKSFDLRIFWFNGICCVVVWCGRCVADFDVVAGTCVGDHPVPVSGHAVVICKPIKKYSSDSSSDSGSS